MSLPSAQDGAQMSLPSAPDDAQMSLPSAPDGAQRSLSAVFDGAGQPLRLSRLPLPARLADGEVLLRLVAATVCGSDVHTIRGVRQEPTPAILGHEGVGRVEVSCRPDLTPGQLVTFCVCDVCGECVRCLTGVTQKCRQLMKYGHTALSSGSGLNGCYSTHIVVRAGTHIVPLPPHLAAAPALAAPINCALATVMSAVRALQRHLPDNARTRALVQGAGLLGVFACAVLRDRLRFTEVFCTDMVAERRRMAQRFGATALEPAVLDDEIAGSDFVDSFDCVIEVCGSPKVFPVGLRCLRPGGWYGLLGMVHPRSALDVTGQQLIRKCATVTGIHNYAAEDLDSAVSYLESVVAEDRYPLRELLSPPFKLQHIQEAVDQSDAYYRALIEP